MTSNDSSEPPAKKPRTKRTIRPPPQYEDIWLDVYLSGTELDQLKDVHKYDWDFTHLDEALMTGALANAPLVHLFGCTEPKILPVSEEDETGTLVVVPVIVAIVSTRPPPAMLGIKSVQRAEEEIVPMSAVRMSWNPRPADNAPRRNPPKPTVFVLKCKERRARLKNMDEVAVHRYDYVMPYIIRPGQEEEDAPDTNVQVLVDDLEGRSNPVMMDFDFEMDELDEFVSEQIEENALDASKHAEPLRSAIRAAVKARKEQIRAEHDAKVARVKEISEEDRKSIASMKLYKFYPSNEEQKYPDVSNSKVSYINRYYGKADDVL